jgi:hypothetical protein
MASSRILAGEEDWRTTPLQVSDHELLRRIGTGSYGEVWLARSTLGAQRAVKVVHRAAFEDSRPYEREFTGLKNFEPVSRGHEGLMDILQVGRNDAEGCFYCVMELADDAGQAGIPNSELRSPNVNNAASKASDPRIQPQTAGTAQSKSYQPLTLEHRIRANGRLPVAECVRLAVTLAEALRYLHERGLVHRDIKPSNIIFVGGVPKLADVGLVAQARSARTFVGTEGFVPPEGPGTPQADLYSLGKCLYEMAMGKDRQAFPSPPTMLDELPDRDELLELNEVIARACDPHPTQRYSSAAALVADLRVMASGQSLRQTWGRARRRRVTAVASGIVAALLLSWGSVQLLRSPRLELVREFALPGNWPARQALLGDFDGCGGPELIGAHQGHLVVVSLEGHLLIERRLPEFRGDAFVLSGLADVDADGCSEVLASWREGTNLFAGVFNQNLSEVKRFTATGSTEERAVGRHPSSFMTVPVFIPESPTASARLIAQMTTHYALWPRWLRAYDYAGQTLLWERTYAAPPVQMRLHDLDDDGTPELVIGCYSPNNGAELPDGESDSHTYLHVLSAHGQQLWSREVGGTYMRCYVYPAASASGNCLYALVVRNEEAHRQSNAELPTESRLLKFDLHGVELARYESPFELTELLLADLTGDGQPELYTADSRGGLHVLDQDLRLQRQVRIMDNAYDWVWLRAELAGDLDGDGQPELVLQGAQVEFVSGTSLGRPEGPANFRRYHRHSLWVYDSRLKPRASYTLNELSKTPPGVRLELLPPEATGRRRLIALDQQVSVLEYRR